NFRGTVVLRSEHGEEGGMGLVINRQAPLKLGDLAKGQQIRVARHREEQFVYLGGPVEPYRGFVLHDSTDVDERHQVCPGLFLSVTSDALAPLLVSADPERRFCLGDAGGGPRQIERELAQGAWLFTEATATPTLDGDPNNLWNETLKGMGVDPAMIVSGGGIH